MIRSSLSLISSSKKDTSPGSPSRSITRYISQALPSLSTSRGMRLEGRTSDNIGGYVRRFFIVECLLDMQLDAGHDTRSARFDMRVKMRVKRQER